MRYASRVAIFQAPMAAQPTIQHAMTVIIAQVGIGGRCTTPPVGPTVAPPASAVTVTVGDMVRSGLWLELYLLTGFVVGLGLGSLMGQRTVPVVLLVVLEIIITPVLADHPLPFFLNGERLVVGVAMDQLKPAALAGGTTVGPSGGLVHLPPMPTWAMISVIAGWIVGWSVIGAWRMATRDA